uniref:CUB domain-containing protein n=1 Tax=Capitella teleta TaxID=283909 RepID=X1ZZB0_CAPTE
MAIHGSSYSHFRCSGNRMQLIISLITLLFTFNQSVQSAVDDYAFCVTTHVDLGGIGSKGNILSDGFPLSLPNVSHNEPMCSMTLMACKSCRITIKIVSLDLPPCDQHPHPQTCIYGCDHLMIYEIADRLRTTKYYMQGQERYQYTSQTSKVFIKFCHSYDNNGKPRRFRLQYTVYEKSETFTGHIGENGTFHSPGFPLGFSNFQSHYQITEEIFYFHIHGLDGGYIRLSFDDWSLPFSSELKVYDGPSKADNLLFPSHQSENSRDRPFLSSSGSNLLLELYTGTGEEYGKFMPGFTARYSFVSKASWRKKPYQHCGQNLYDLMGGVLDLQEMAECPTASYIDCVWVIWKYDFRRELQFLAVRFDALNLYNGDVLELRLGNNSESEMVGSASSLTLGHEVLTRGDAIYIRLKARCSRDRSLRVVFTTYEDVMPSQVCSGKNMFSCLNSRCISQTLLCDGINHCNDQLNFDEVVCKSRLLTPTPMYSVCFILFYQATTTTERPCSSHAECRGHGWYCADKRCDGYYDCEDGSDEHDCWLSAMTTPALSTSAPNYTFSAYHWGTIIPILLICIVLAVIACVVVNYTRKRQLQRQRRRAAAQPHLGLPGQMFRYPEAPPTYEEAMYSGGILNRSFSFSEAGNTLPPPPPYTIQVAAPSLSDQYAVTPPAAASTTAPPSSEAPVTSGPLAGHGALGDMQVLLPIHLQAMRGRIEPDKPATPVSNIVPSTPKEESSEDGMDIPSADASSSYV